MTMVNADFPPIVKPAPKKRNRTGERLRARGFDLTTYHRHPDGNYYRPRCSQCQVMVINGVACHEHRCPNQTGD